MKLTKTNPKREPHLTACPTLFARFVEAAACPTLSDQHTALTYANDAVTPIPAPLGNRRAAGKGLLPGSVNEPENATMATTPQREKGNRFMNRANRFLMMAQMLGLLLWAGASSIAFGQAQPAQDDVRNVFLKGRETYETPTLEAANPTPSPVRTPGTPPRKRSVQLEPDAEIVRREARPEPRTKEESATPRKSPVPAPATTANPRLPIPQLGQNLALGYTLFKRETDGQWMRVDPTQMFRSGDSVRFTLETSVPGYLYVLQRRNEDGAAILLFPHAQIAKGNNYLDAHRLQEMPTSTTTEQWFDISGPAGAETLFFVFSRRPLPMIPARDMLVAYCQEEPNECTKLKPFIWNWLAARQNRPTVTMTNPTYGQKLLPEEVTSIKQGARLKAKSPLPAVMTMLANKAADPDEDLIVTKVTLTHK